MIKKFRLEIGIIKAQFVEKYMLHRLALVAAENKNNKERTKNATNHKYPANNPAPYGGQMDALSGVSFVALETYNVISSATSCFSTTPHLNRFSTDQALSNRCFHGYLSADVSA